MQCSEVCLPACLSVCRIDGWLWWPVPTCSSTKSKSSTSSPSLPPPSLLHPSKLSCDWTHPGAAAASSACQRTTSSLPSQAIVRQRVSTWCGSLAGAAEELSAVTHTVVWKQESRVCMTWVACQESLMVCSPERNPLSNRRSEGNYFVDVTRIFHLNLHSKNTCQISALFSSFPTLCVKINGNYTLGRTRCSTTAAETNKLNTLVLGKFAAHLFLCKFSFHFQYG